MSKLQFKSLLRGPFASVTDQFLYSVSNFLLVVFLARQMTAQDFGYFVSVYSVGLFFFSISEAFVCSLIPVIGGALNGKHVRYYVFNVYFISLGAGVGFSAIIWALSFVGTVLDYSIGHVGLYLGGYVLVCFPASAYRRACFLERRYNHLLVGTIIYTAVIAGSVAVFHFFKLTWENGLLALTIAGAFSILGYGWNKPLRFRGPSRNRLVGFLKAHVRQGKWLFANAVIHWSTSAAGIPLIITALAGAESAGSFRALTVLLNPIGLLIVALSNFLIPYWTSSYRNRGWSYLEKLTKIALICLIALFTLYAIPLNFFIVEVITFVYGKELYVSAGEAVFVVLSVAYLLDAGKGAYSTALLVTENSKLILLSRLFSLATFLIIGLPLISWFGLLGVSYGYLFSTLTMFMSLVVYYNILARKCSV